MDKNGARGRAEKTISSFITGLLEVDGMMDRLLMKRYGDKDEVAAIKQAIQDIANEHARYAELHRAVEQGTAARQLYARSYTNAPLTLSITNDDGDGTPPSVLCDGLYGPRIVTMYCTDAVAANKLFEALQAVIGVEAD